MSTPSPAPGSDGRVTPARTLADERKDYRSGRLLDDTAQDPFSLFDTWMTEAFARRDEYGDLSDPSAAVLSTVARGSGGTLRPRSRTVLLKGRDERGLTLFTGYESAKGRELAENPSASLLLPWYALQRQVRIEGTAERIPDAEADDYFAQRPRGSRLAAWASRQSWPIGSRAELDAQYARAEARFEDRDIPRPAYWGGYRVLPDYVEFWQGRTNRLHDRIAYRRIDTGAWQRYRLQP